MTHSTRHTLLWCQSPPLPDSPFLTVNPTPTEQAPSTLTSPMYLCSFVVYTEFICPLHVLLHEMCVPCLCAHQWPLGWVTAVVELTTSRLAAGRVGSTHKLSYVHTKLTRSKLPHHAYVWAVHTRIW